MSELPEDRVNWSEHFEARCYFYPGRDCPGCVEHCARVGHELPEDRDDERV